VKSYHSSEVPERLARRPDDHPRVRPARRLHPRRPSGQAAQRRLHRAGPGRGGQARLYPVAPYLAAQADAVPAQHGRTSGEAEWALVVGRTLPIRCSPWRATTPTGHWRCTASPGARTPAWTCSAPGPGASPRWPTTWTRSGCGPGSGTAPASSSSRTPRWRRQVRSDRLGLRCGGMSFEDGDDLFQR
jgi:hypothetical protein